MTFYFSRKIRLNITTQAGASFEVENFRINFSVTKTNEKDLNTAEISVTNLAKSTRDSIINKNNLVELYAGYLEGEGEALIFKGYVERGEVEYQLPEIITKLNLIDGSFPLRTTKISLSKGSGVSKSEIIKEIANKLGLPFIISPVLTSVYKSGYSFYGLAKKSLDEIAKSEKYNWKIIDNVLIFKKINEALTQDILLLSKETGLLESPSELSSINDELNKSKNNTLSFSIKSLLQPTLSLGHLIKINSRDITGTFIVDRLTHNGDSEEGEFVTELEVRRV